MQDAHQRNDINNNNNGSAVGIHVPQEQTAMMCYVQHCAHLTNLGAHFFSIGDDYKAFGAFKRALDILNQAAENEDLDEISNQEVYFDDASMLPQPAVLPFDCERNEKALYGTADEEDKSVFFVCSKPFVFDLAALDVTCTPIYIATVIFGMTLLLLRKAVSAADDKKSLLKALHLFDMALVLLRSTPNHVDSSNITLAVLNNKVHVCYCLHQFDEAHACLEEMAEILPIACGDMTTFEEPELNGMILNTLLPTDPTRLARAA